MLLFLQQKVKVGKIEDKTGKEKLGNETDKNIETEKANTGF